MAIPSNRSPSPLSSRPNPHSRNSESNSSIRRSFSGNPFPRPSVLTNPKSFNPVTPANSPAGFGRQNSFGKEGMGQLQSCDEKENDKDQILKPVKVRSPAANGSKNFMSPTISAASKFTPSPRKKPLVERNEPVRTSISLSDGKATFFSTISSENTEDFVPQSELPAEQKKGDGGLGSTVTRLDQTEEVLECPPASKAMKRVTFAELPSDSEKACGIPSETAIIDSDCLNVESDPKDKPSCSSVSPVIAPLDADPSIPPYDPKTNYLSPRPQFLRYKPNPRIEVLLNNKDKVLDSEIKQLEDSFTVESSTETFSDTDGTEESNSEDSPKDSEDSSAETEEPEVKEEEVHVFESSLFSTTTTHETPEEEELPVSEKLDIGTSISPEIPDNVFREKGKEKRSFFASLKFLSPLLVFLIGVIAISITNSPVMDSSVLKPVNFSELLHLPSGVADTAKANFDAFAGRFKQPSFDLISHFSMLIDNLGRHDILRPIQFINLTELQKDILVEGLQASQSFPIGQTAHEVSENVIGGKGSEKRAGNSEKEVLEEEEVGESLPFEEEICEGAISDDNSETEQDGEIDTETEELTSTSAPVPQMKEPESLETVWSQEEVASDNELKCKINASDALEFQSEEKAPKTQPQLLEIMKLEGAIDLSSAAKIQPSSVVDINPESISDSTPLSVEHRHSEMVESSVGALQDMLSAYHITGLTSMVLGLISAAAYVYLKRGTTSKQNAVVHFDQLSKNIIPASSVREQIHQKIPSSQNWPTEVDVMGESCPSEMSSFQTSSQSRLRSANEAQSQERKPRKHSKRESLASSSECSMGSPSYGSFTTYEKIPSKHANGDDDEIMTPVRRSSRIRSLVTSP